MTTNSNSTSLNVRNDLVEALERDLVGPARIDAILGSEIAREQLPGWERPSKWYLTGFLIPSGTPPEKSADADEDDDLDVIPESEGISEESSDERKAAKKGFFPSSMGLSFLVDRDTRVLSVTVHWGAYTLTEVEGADNKPQAVWQREPKEIVLRVSLSGADVPVVRDVDSNGLQVHVVERSISAENLEDQLPAGTRSVSVFLVNSRTPVEDNPDRAYVFQPEIEVSSDRPFVPRPDLRGARGIDWDEQVSDLHYSDTPEFATGHGVSAEWEIEDNTCSVLRTAWVGKAEVEKTSTFEVPGVELSMEALGGLTDAAAIDAALTPLVIQYRAWIAAQRSNVSALEGKRRLTADELLRLAEMAATRIETGIARLANDADALDAFRVANRAVARALRKRLGIDEPRWRAFQIAFILLNLPGLADPKDANRETVDLLFFPTGGGKTEAYLGLAAFAMVLRRLATSGREWHRGRGSERDHALHAAVADARSIGARGRPCMCT